MSNLEVEPVPVTCVATPSDGSVWELLTGRDVVLGGARAMGTDGALTVTRTLPNKSRRMVGAWCFVDHFGGAEKDGLSGPAAGDGMQVPPHPHTGLQTVTWLVEGAVHHYDSLANSQLITPGQLNLMTAGRAITHAEISPARASLRAGQMAQPAPPRLHGVQLWVALPDSDRTMEPAFAHHEDLPVGNDGAASITVLMGSLAGLVSPARVFSPLVGAEITLAASGSLELPLDATFEHAVLVLSGAAEVDGTELAVGPLLYLGQGRDRLRLSGSARGETRLLLIGGEPFEEEIIMWWNFIGRSHDEIVADREDWTAGRRFATVPGYDGPALPAPEMPTTRLKPRGRAST